MLSQKLNRLRWLQQVLPSLTCQYFADASLYHTDYLKVCFPSQRFDFLAQTRFEWTGDLLFLELIKQASALSQMGISKQERRSGTIDSLVGKIQSKQLDALVRKVLSCSVICPINYFCYFPGQADT